MSMQVRAARRLQTADSRAAEILDALAVDLKSCTAEVRQLVDELRPPALDRGLEAALRAECQRFDTAGLSVQCEVDGDLDGLPAAVEVVAFRIVAEALTNVAHHSGARICRVVVHRNSALRVEVVDDGVGIASSVRVGVGLSSMRERAAELGGDCVIGPAPGGGTSVRLELPLGPAEDDQFLLELGAALRSVGPITDEDLARATTAFTWRSVYDVTLAELVYDSSIQDRPPGQSEIIPGTRTLIFEGDTMSVEVDVTADAVTGRVVLSGRTDISLMTVSDTVGETTTDDTGRFAFAAAPSGPVRLLCRTATTRLLTDWVRM